MRNMRHVAPLFLVILAPLAGACFQELDPCASGGAHCPATVGPGTNSTSTTALVYADGGVCPAGMVVGGGDGIGGHGVCIPADTTTPPIQINEVDDGAATADPCVKTDEQSLQIRTTYCSMCHSGASSTMTVMAGFLASRAERQGPRDRRVAARDVRGRRERSVGDSGGSRRLPSLQLRRGRRHAAGRQPQADGQRHLRHPSLDRVPRHRGRRIDHDFLRRERIDLGFFRRRWFDLGFFRRRWFGLGFFGRRWFDLGFFWRRWFDLDVLRRRRLTNAAPCVETPRRSVATKAQLARSGFANPPRSFGAYGLRTAQNCATSAGVTSWA